MFREILDLRAEYRLANRAHAQRNIEIEVEKEDTQKRKHVNLMKEV